MLNELIHIFQHPDSSHFKQEKLDFPNIDCASIQIACASQCKKFQFHFIYIDKYALSIGTIETSVLYKYLVFSWNKVNLLLSNQYSAVFELSMSTGKTLMFQLLLRRACTEARIVQVPMVCKAAGAQEAKKEHGQDR